MDYHDILRKRLCKYVKEHNFEDTKLWDNRGNVHYFIAREDDEFIVAHAIVLKYQGVVYFPSEDVAEKAISEVVKPFMIEHPAFVR